MALSFDSSDTSLITRRLMRPSLSTKGVKFSEMPNFLKLIWVVQTWVVGSQEYPAGTGNSPPAMKVADSPEIAVRFGSARVRMTPALSIPRRVACTDGVAPNFVVRALPSTRFLPRAVKGLELVKLTTEVP